MEERLQVRIEADIKDFQQGMNKVEQNLRRAEGIFSSSSKRAFQLENAIAQLSKEYKSGSISSGQYSSNLDKLNAELSQQRSNVSASAKEVDRLNKLMSANQLRKVASANQNVAQSFKGLSTNVRGSNTVALEFNRIIQDAPFGMIGIGNNLQQLAGNFSNLSKQAGGTVPAIKAAFSAMVTGPNLALLAISALTAGITAYNMGAFDFIGANKAKKKSLEDLQSELDEYRQTLEITQQQSIVGRQNAQQEITLLDALAAQAQNTALSQEQRTDAVEELQKKYPSYLGNLTDEQIKTGDVSEEIGKLRTNLIETAKAYAMIDKVRENSIALLDMESRAITRASEIRDKANKLNDLTQEAKDIRSSGSMALAGQALESIDLSKNRITKELNDLLAKQTVEGEKIREINQENLALQERTNVALENGGNLVKNTVDQVNKVGSALKDIEPFDASQLFRFDIEELQKQIQDSYKTINDNIKNDGFINVPVKVDFTPETLTGDAKSENDDIVERFHQQKDDIEAIFTDLGRSMQMTLAGAFEGAISGGENFFDAVISGFRKMLAQLAAQLAASAVIKVLGMIIGGPAGAAIGIGGSGGIGSLLGGVLGGSGMRIGQTPALGVPSTGTSSAGYKVDVKVHGVLRGNDIHVAAQRNNRDFNRYY